ncbi:MAG: bacteriocin [Clostridia bacterium]|nr:bacteriocin [Clostridia bacterium]
MKKLTIKEMQNVKGGASVSYSDVCIGTWDAHKRRHETTITGSHASLVIEAKRDFNLKLEKHKNSGSMIHHTHSLDPVAI